jgi:hypothetical protein
MSISKTFSRNNDALLPWCITTILGTLIYWVVVTDGTLNLTGWERFGLAYNSYLINLLNGSLAVDPETIRREGFYDGETAYMYFGVLPALLRLPFLPFVDFETTYLARLIVFLCSAATASLCHAIAINFIRRVDSTLDPKMRTIWYWVTGLLCWGNSATVILISSASVYHEPLAVGLFLAILYLFVVLRYWQDSSQSNLTVLATLALIAGISVHARPTVAIGLYLATCALAISLWIARNHWRPNLKVATKDALLIGTAPALILISFGALLLAMNYARWGDPFVMAPLDRYGVVLQVEGISPRIEAMIEEGRFNLLRIPANLAGHLLGGMPAWHEALISLFNVGVVRLEQPTIGIVMLFVPLIFMAIHGVGRLRAFWKTEKAAAVPLLLVGAAYCVTAFLIFAYATVTYRYKVEIWPLLFFLSLFGLVGILQISAGPNAKRHNRYHRFIVFCSIISIYFLFNAYFSYQSSGLYAGEGSNALVQNDFLRSILLIEIDAP